MINRVMQPFTDQCDYYSRLGTFFFFFALSDDDVRLVPFVESPVLQRVGIVRKCTDEDAPTTREWRVARAKVNGLRRAPGWTRRKDRVERLAGTAIRVWARIRKALGRLVAQR